MRVPLLRSAQRLRTSADAPHLRITKAIDLYDCMRYNRGNGRSVMTEKIWGAQEFLVAEGQKEKITRGKWSRAHHEYLRDALARGVKFSDYPKSDVKVQTKTGTKVVKSVSSAPAEIGDVIYIYPEHAFKAVQPDGKTRSMREICRPCGYSLVICTCAYYSRTPRIVALDGRGDVDVSIERK